MADWQDVGATAKPAPSGWQDVAPTPKPKAAASGWQDIGASDIAQSLAAGDQAAESPAGILEAIGGGTAQMGTAALKGAAGLAGAAGDVEAAASRGAIGADEGWQDVGKGAGVARQAAERALAPVDKILEPETPTGKGLLDVMGLPAAGAKRAGEKTLDVTGSPLAATGVETALNAAMMLLPFLRRGGEEIKVGERPPEAPPAVPEPPVPPEAAAPRGAPGIEPTPTPEPSAGTVRLYRGQKPGEVGEWHTTDPELARQYGPEVYAVDVPADVYRSAASVTGERGVRIPPEYARKATKVEDVAPLPTYEVTEAAARDPAIAAMKEEIGWGEVGGRGIRERAGWEAPGAPNEGDFVARTPWVPKSDFWRNRPDLRLKPGQASAAIDKYLAGEKLKPIEQRFVDHTLNTIVERDFADSVAAEIDRQASHADYAAAHDHAGLEFNEDNALAMAKITRARELDPAAFARIPEQADDAVFQRHVQDILDQHPTEATNAPERPIQAISEGERPFAPLAEEPPAGADIPAAAGGGGDAGPPPSAPTPPGAEPEPPLKRQGKMPVEVAQKKPNALVDAVRKIFAPATRGAAAERTSGITRANLGELAHDWQQAQVRLHKFGAMMDKLPEAERYDFIDAIETGRKQTNPRLQPVADEMRGLLDEWRGEVQKLGTGALESFIENYFPHIWKDPVKAAATMEDIAARNFGKRPLAGPGSFLKQRTIPTTAEGLRSGLEPITSNPIDLTLLKIREMQRFVMGTKIMQEMKATGLAQFVKFGRSAPEGWIRIDDKAARVLQWDEAQQGFILRGHYYAPEPAATIINNYLRPGLQGNEIYDTVRGAGNILNMAQLGFSAFHLGFTTLDAMVSKTALGIEKIARGDVAAGLQDFAAGTIPGINVGTAVRNVLRGEKLSRAYDVGSADPMMAKLVDALAQSGGRTRMDAFYNATRGGSYWNSIVNRRLIQDMTRNGIPRGAAEFFPRLVQTISAPIMEYLVPRQKLGVFSDMMRDALEHEPDMTPERMRVVGGKIWDSIDNRLGEMVYDNLHWNRVMKDLAFISMRSVGWNWGTIREIGGGLIDYGKAAGDLAQGKAPTMTHKMAYVAALPIVAGIWGATLTYLMTGESPKELKDYFFPRTGRLTKDGYPERLSPPTYMKDVFEYYHAPGQTLVNKMNPLIGVVNQMYKNEDFYGAQIRDQDADGVKQLAQELTYLGKQMLPFSLRGAQRQKEEGAPVSEQAMSFLGFPPAPAYITRPPEVEKAIERRRDASAIRKRLRQEAQP